jgi:Double zinc ribbon
MRCSNCGSENSESAKFCDSCAAPVPVRCPSCGSSNRPDAVSTASRLLALPKLEQIKIATGDYPRQAARQATGQLEMKNGSDIDPTRLLEKLTSRFEKTPTGEMLLCDQRTISYAQCEKLTELARACVTRIADLVTRLEAPILCSYQSCGKTYNQGRKRRVPGGKYCSPLCAQRAGEPSAWKRPQ